MSLCHCASLSHLSVQEPGDELDVLLPVQGLLWEGGMRLDFTWQQEGRAGYLLFGCQTAGKGCPCWEASASSVPVFVAATGPSCRRITIGLPTCTSRANRLRGREPVTPHLSPRGAGGDPAGPPPSVPAREEAAVPDGGGARAAVHGSLDHKHLCLCRAHRLLLDTQGTLQGHSQGSPHPGVTPAPGGSTRAVGAVNHTPTSHPGTPNLTTAPSHGLPRTVAHVAGSAEMALGVDGREDEAGRHLPPAREHPQQQEAGTLRQQPLQLGPAVDEAPALWLCLQRDPATSWDSHSPTIPRHSTPGAWGVPGDTSPPPI